MSLIKTIFKFLFGSAERIFLTVMGLIIAGLLSTIVINNVKIDKLQKDNEVLAWNNAALNQEQVKKIDDHRFDIIPEKVNLKEELDKAEKEWFKKNEIKIQSIDAYTKVRTKIDTVFLPSKIQNDPDPVQAVTRNHKLDFSSKNHTNLVTFKSKNDSIFDAKNRFILEDSIRYVSREEKVRVGTKKFLFFKFPKYEKFTKITVSNSNDIVKMDDVVIKVKEK